ncbi:hypothetical protein D3C80_1234930 [compost metagenome]
MLKEIFAELVVKYCHDEIIAEQLWSEIEMAYTSSERYYHNLSHLQAVYDEIKEQDNLVGDINTMLFALFYHDFVYDPLKSDNELQSANFAKQRLEQIGCQQNIIDKCYSLIMATKGHNRVEDNDINMFTDADISILGKDWETYLAYSQSIRKEYQIYPDEIYYPGRAKVLTHFLSMEAIYKTDDFHTKYEKQAKANLLRELKLTAQ